MSSRFQTGFLADGLATGIGSLPYLDPEEALALIFSYLPDIPHWPQLPQRGKQEHFVHQFLQPLVDCGMLVSEGDHWVFNTSGENYAECLTDFYRTCLPAEEDNGECLQTFLPTPEAAAGFHAFLARAQTGGLKGAKYVKGQIAGPLTVALELKDQQGRPSYYHGDLRDTIVRTLALNARSQAAALSGFGSTPIIFIDDPSIRAFGSRLHLALSREMIIEDLTFIISAVQSEKGMVGIHSCEAVDWSLLMESQTQILSLDAFRFGSSLIPYSAQLSQFLERGGVIAWGIVPTLDNPLHESAESLMERLNTLWDDLFSNGPSRELVLSNSMITPACGTGLLAQDWAKHIYSLNAALSQKLRSKMN